MPRRVFHLKVKNPLDKVLGIGDVGKVLVGIQDVIYHIAEIQYSGKRFRISGKRDKGLQERTKLRFINVESGSFLADVAGEAQTPLFGETIVSEAMNTLGDLTQILNEEERPKAEIDKILKNPLQRSRVLRDMVEFWPGQDNNYELELRLPNYECQELDSNRRLGIKEMARLPTETITEELFGVITEARFARGPTQFEIVGPHGKIRCAFRREMADDIHTFLRKVAMLKAKVEIDEAGNIREVSDILNIKKFDCLHLPHIVTEQGEISLKEPLDVTICFEDENWIFENEPLHIVEYNRDYSTALADFQDQFLYLYKRYLKGRTDNLVGNAILMRQYLAMLTGETTR